MRKDSLSVIDPDPEPRWKSVEALSKFQQEASPAYEELAKATKDKDWRVRIGTAHALSHMGSISIPILTSMLSVDDATVSVETIHVLGAMGREADSAVAALVKTMKWPLEGFPEETTEALKKSARQVPGKLCRRQIDEELGHSHEAGVGPNAVNLTEIACLCYR